jgi:hypothetical protein
MGNKFTNFEKNNIIPKHKLMKNVAGSVLKNIEEKLDKDPQKIIDSWPQMIDQKLVSMTKAVSFEKGVLVVKVLSSTLHSLLSTYEKKKILQKLQKKFSIVQNIIFKIG